MQLGVQYVIETDPRPGLLVTLAVVDKLDSDAVNRTFVTIRRI